MPLILKKIVCGLALSSLNNTLLQFNCIMSNLFICFNFFLHKSDLIDVDNIFDLVHNCIYLKDCVEAEQIKGFSVFLDC